MTAGAQSLDQPVGGGSGHVFVRLRSNLEAAQVTPHEDSDFNVLRRGGEKCTLRLATTPGSPEG